MINYAAQIWSTDLALINIEKFKNRKNIIVPCGYSALVNKDTLRWSQFRKYFDSIIPFYLPKYDHAVYNSENYQDYEYSISHNFENSIIINNFYDDKEMENVEVVSFKEKNNIKNNYILCVSNFFRSKNQERLINIFKKSNLKNVDLVLIGKEGEMYDYLKQISSDNENIKIFKDIDRIDTVNAFRESTIFGFTSEIESSPIVILESLANSKPFISFNVGQIRDIEDGGYIVNSDDEFVEKLKMININPEELKSKGQDGYILVSSKYSLTKIVKEYEKLFK
jgi:glycosyltransferase involved in cell wall biosynthesis